MIAPRDALEWVLRHVLPFEGVATLPAQDVWADGRIVVPAGVRSCPAGTAVEPRPGGPLS